MTPEDFARERRYLFGVAYRMLGSAADADDVLQEAWLRARDVTPERSPRALLATIVTRLCLDALGAARRRRETYEGPWLPEPVADATDDERHGDPAVRAESVTIAFLSVLDALTPLERAVFVLREVFDFEFAEVADATGRSEAACRQVLHRARAALADHRRARQIDPASRDAISSRFFAAIAGGDLGALVEALTADARGVADHGGKASAARREVAGADRLGRFLVGLAKRGLEQGALGEVVSLNGAPAVVIWERGSLTSAVLPDVVDTEHGPRVATVFVLRNPDKLRRLEAVLRARRG